MKKEVKKNKIKRPVKNQEEEKLFPEFNLKQRIKQNKSLITMLGIILVVILIVAVSILYKDKGSKFTYEGIPFEKNYLGNILLYTSKISFMNSQGQVLKTMEIDFRNNPRTLEDIPVKIFDLRLIPNINTYVVDADVKSGCEDSGIAFINFARFLTNLELNVKGAVGNYSKSIENNVTFANCDKYPNNTVIMIKNGDKTQIEQTSVNCYLITFKD
ncbi:hypothetical protein FJZ17_03720 [Candidatus Pacearchaeota archaeon]|nr:hypothetical protein [Candidatus Pacearchaeota archaeon]